MNTSRKASIAAGVLFLVATPASLTAAALLPALSGGDWLTQFGRQPHRVTASALLYLVAFGCSAGIAVALYPVVRAFDAALALGSVVFRGIEAAFYSAGVICLLTILSLTERLDGASTTEVTAYRALAESLVSTHEHTAAVGVIAFTVGAFMYYLVVYRARLVPRWLSGWGMLGTATMMLGAVLAVLSDSPVTGYLLLVAPIGVQEMVFALWLLIRGFRNLPPRLPTSTEGSREIRAAV